MCKGVLYPVRWGGYEATAPPCKVCTLSGCDQGLQGHVEDAWEAKNMTEGRVDIEELLQEVERAEGLDEASVAITTMRHLDVWHMDFSISDDIWARIRLWTIGFPR